MAYRKAVFMDSQMTSVEKMEGETIEQKMERVIDSGEAITDGAPEIFTERKDGVLSAYNIRTDRWEIAAEAMDKVHMNAAAKREEKAGSKPEMKVVEGDGTNGEGVSEG